MALSDNHVIARPVRAVAISWDDKSGGTKAPPYGRIGNVRFSVSS